VARRIHSGERPRGLILTQARRDPQALRQALDGALALIGTYRPSTRIFSE
jgi:hypothetical protein